VARPAALSTNAVFVTEAKCASETSASPGADQWPSSGDLSSACEYVLLAKSSISIANSVITGDIGVPIAHDSRTGFGLVADSSGEFSTASQVVGKAYAADCSGLHLDEYDCCGLCFMEAAYTDASRRCHHHNYKK
jgi:hypothetical protein